MIDGPRPKQGFETTTQHFLRDMALHEFDHEQATECNSLVPAYNE